MSTFDITNQARRMAVSPEELKLRKFAQSILNNALLDDNFDVKLRWRSRKVNSIDCRPTTGGLQVRRTCCVRTCYVTVGRCV